MRSSPVGGVDRSPFRRPGRWVGLGEGGPPGFAAVGPPGVAAVGPPGVAAVGPPGLAAVGPPGLGEAGPPGLGDLEPGRFAAYELERLGGPENLPPGRGRFWPGLGVGRFAMIS